MNTLQYRNLVTQDVYEKASDAILREMKANISDELFGCIPEDAWTYIRWRIEHDVLDGRVDFRLVIETSESKDDVIEMLEGRLDRSYSRGAKLEQLCLDMYKGDDALPIANRPDIKERMTDLGLLEELHEQNNGNS